MTRPLATVQRWPMDRQIPASRIASVALVFNGRPSSRIIDFGCAPAVCANRRSKADCHIARAALAAFGKPKRAADAEQYRRAPEAPQAARGGACGGVEAVAVAVAEPSAWHWFAQTGLVGSTRPFSADPRSQLSGRGRGCQLSGGEIALPAVAGRPFAVIRARSDLTRNRRALRGSFVSMSSLRARSRRDLARVRCNIASARLRRRGCS
jgi:hypothetical protein